MLMKLNCRVRITVHFQFYILTVNNQDTVMLSKRDINMIEIS